MNTDQLEQYNQWNEKKKGLQNRSFPNLYFKEGEIWWCSAGLNVGKEVFGKGKDFKRPVLVLKKLSADLCIVLPVTSQARMGTWFNEVNFGDEKRWIMLYQIKLYDKKRFWEKAGRINNDDFIQTKEKLEVLLELSKHRPSAVAEFEGISPQSDVSLSNLEIVSIGDLEYAEIEPFIVEYCDTIPFA